MLKRIRMAAGRRFGAWPLALLSQHLRAEVLEGVSDGMIVDTKIHDGVIRFFAPSPQLIFRAQSALTKETDTIAWIDGFEADGTFWDIGANVGVYSLYAAMRRRARVLAFEPSAANFYALSRNIDLNRLSEDVTGYCLAFAEQSRLGILNLASHSVGAALNQFGRPGDKSRYWSQATPSATHGTIGFAIDDFIDHFSPPFPTYLKIDVDGIELSILEGARRTLSDPRLQSMMIELDVDSSEVRCRALRLLEEAGFRLAAVGEPQGTPAAQAANHRFERVSRG